MWYCIKKRDVIKMSEKLPLLPVKNDFVFKLIFGDQRNVDILSGFLTSVLDIPESEYEQLTITDPHVKKETIDDKYGVLDVKVKTKSGDIVHIEIQLKVHSNLKERTIYSQSKMITEQVLSGDNWRVIKRVISIVITDEIFMHEGDKYHNQFRYRTTDGLEFTNLVEINTLDLKKLPLSTDNTELWHWMKFIKTGDEQEMEMLATRSPQMRKAVGILKELSADERTRLLFESHEMARRDMESIMYDEVKKKDAVIAAKDAALADKDAEIERLRKQLANQKVSQEQQ